MKKSSLFIKLWMFTLLAGPHLSCVSTNSSQGTSAEVEVNSPTDYWVRYVGNRRNILQKGDLSARIDLKSISNISSLYALGPVEGLQGEITIYNGTPSVATIINGRPQINPSFNHRAIFLAYANVYRWKKVTVAVPLNGIKTIENYVRQEALRQGISPQEPFPFRIEGLARKLNYNITFKTDSLPHNRKEHQRAKRRFQLQQEQIRMIGFWASSSTKGAYTQPGRSTRLHFQLPGNTASGHVDEVHLQRGARLYLPAQ